jgi:hypothetical protein
VCDVNLRPFRQTQISSARSSVVVRVSPIHHKKRSTTVSKPIAPRRTNQSLAIFDPSATSSRSYYHTVVEVVLPADKAYHGVSTSPEGPCSPSEPSADRDGLASGFLLPMGSFRRHALGRIGGGSCRATSTGNDQAAFGANTPGAPSLPRWSHGGDQGGQDHDCSPDGNLQVRTFRM